MTGNAYYPPEYRKEAFTCPHCQVYTLMHWDSLRLTTVSVSPLDVAGCQHCGKVSFWGSNNGPSDIQQKMIYPYIQSAPMPHPNMPDEVRVDYMEARAVMGFSSKAAAALLRLSLQNLCIHLGKSHNINRAIGELVADGLPLQVQQALDAVRIIGNESVHPGEILPEDLDLNIGKVFELMNFIVQDRIARFKEIEELYQGLPESKRRG